MELYTERLGIRKPLEKTYGINKKVYSILLNCCKQYQNNLIHIFTLRCHHNFIGRDYIVFDEDSFETRMEIRIPTLFRNKDGKIDAPIYDVQYNQYALLDFIEYFAQNIKDITKRWNNLRYRDYIIIDCLPISTIFQDFQEKINEIFTEAGLLYKLTDRKIIERVIENSVLTKEMETSIELISENGIKELLKDAIILYKTPNLKARRDSVEKIWDALERLKTYYTTLKKSESINKIVNDMSNGDSNFIKLFDNEFRMLTDIGNNYRIRHHETNTIDITDYRYYDYLFNRCLSLINLSIQCLI